MWFVFLFVFCWFFGFCLVWFGFCVTVLSQYLTRFVFYTESIPVRIFWVILQINYHNPKWKFSKVPLWRTINSEKIISPAAFCLRLSYAKSFIYCDFFFLHKWWPLNCCVAFSKSKWSTGDRWNIHRSAEPQKGVVLDVYLSGASLGLCTRPPL